jgi:hypothetical protein
MSVTTKTFMIATTLDGQWKREHPYVDEFESSGHQWVVHPRLGGIGYTVSHKASGYALPKCESVRRQEAKMKAMAILEAKADKVLKAIAGVMK